MPSQTFAEVIAEFGTSAKSKLTNLAIKGAPEDQLRSPVEALVKALAGLSGFAGVSLVGETPLPDIKTRPDFAVSHKKALIGFVELKAPGKGADPRKFNDEHDKKQWEKLKSLPNLLYSDGNDFSLWQDGKLIGEIVKLNGNIETSGAKLAAPDALLVLVSNFLNWDPIPPKTAKQLAHVSARLCRLLREQVVEELAQNNAELTGLKNDWRKLLFPQADDAQFADGYAQAVTFGLLVARARDISLANGLQDAAQELRASNSLIATALRLLTDNQDNQKALKTSLDTMTRVFEEVNWHTISQDKADAWLYFYEDFLDVYDKELRKKTGSYYTPPEVVDAMVNLVDECLRGPLFERAKGLAADDVVIADPAVGTGTFLLGVLRKIAQIVTDDQGAGAVSGAIKAAAKRLVGFELQFGPYAVAQLRLIAELQALMGSSKLPELRLFITDTLGNPFVEEENLGQMYEPIAVSRRQANKVKREERITVVIGNPPYKDKAKGRGGWVESGSKGRQAPMQWWTPPTAWGVGLDTKHLKNLYIYFWRWATWKVFGSGFGPSTGLQESEKAGVICFITASGFLAGDGFQKMRDDLRRSCNRIWVIDCSPEGHQPDVPTRVFQGVQQPICIVVGARTNSCDPETPARVQFRVLPKGSRNTKFETLIGVSLHDEGWLDCPTGWRDQFLPNMEGAWSTFPAMDNFFLRSSSGVLPGRTWVVAPDAESLRKRWGRLINETSLEKKEELFFPTLRDGKVADRHIQKLVSDGLYGYEHRAIPIAKDSSSVVDPVRFGFRSFDRQWIIPDNRLLLSARPNLWETQASNQVHLVSLERRAPESGPSITFSGLLPDMNFFKGSSGGRVFPLWLNAAASRPNIKPALSAYLASIYGRAVKAEDVLAYLAAVMAHPKFTSRFESDLVRPGLRVPVTADAELFAQAVSIGSEVIWLHSYGERFTDPATGRLKQAPRLPNEIRPTIPANGEIPGAPEPLPETMDYDPATQRLKIGKGFVEHVTPQMWAYKVSEKEVLWHWFSYRRRDRTRPVIGDRRPPSPLDKIQPDHWLAEYTTDLLDLLNVLGRLIALEPQQADLLGRICDGSLLDGDDLRKAGAFADTDEKPAPKKSKSKSKS